MKLNVFPLLYFYWITSNEEIDLVDPVKIVCEVLSDGGRKANRVISYTREIYGVELRCCHTQSTSQRAFAATIPLRRHPRPPPPSADWLPF